jgi:tetratricopeptide (TPR) repeat protein
MSDLRKILANMDKINESTAQPAAKPVIAEGSMLKALDMVSKSVAPAAELAKEFKMFKESDGRGNKYHVTVDHHGANQDVPLYTKTYPVYGPDEQTAINTVKKLVGGRNHRIESAGISEAGYYNPLEQDRRNQHDMDAERRNFKRQEHNAEWEVEKRLTQQRAAQEAGTWYIRINGKIFRDRTTGQPAAFNGKAHAAAVARKMMAKEFNAGKEFMLTMRPDDVAKSPVTESAGEPSVDDILYYLTSAYRNLQKYADSYQDFSDITRIYENLRYDLKAGDYAAFQKTYEDSLSRYPDAAVELFDAMFVEAGLPEEQGTIEQFIEKCSATNEGIGDTIKRGVKQVKRGMQGWGGVQGKPGDIVKRNKGYDDKTVKNLALKGKIYKDVDGEPDEHSPQALQNRVIDREMKKRGLGEADDNTDLLALAAKHEKTGEWEWNNGNYEGAKRHYAKANELRDRAKKQQGVAEAEGTPEGLPHLTKELLSHIVQQIGTEGAHAIVKSLEWGDGAAEELLDLIKQDLENDIELSESVKQRLDKSCWAGYRKAGTKIKGGVKVNNCVKESFGVFSRFDESAPIKTFALKEDAVAMAKRYNKLNPMAGITYVVRNVTEAMAPAVATASQKMNPAAGRTAPNPATGAPNSPAAAAPQIPGQANAASVDPKVAQAKKAAMQSNIQKLNIPGVNASQTADSMEKADDMNVPLSSTDTANNSKIAATLGNVLQDPQGAQQLKTLTDKYRTQPGK